VRIGRGVAGPVVERAFADADVTLVDDSTLFRVHCADQSALNALHALHGMLQRIQNFGIEVVDIHPEQTVPQ
jgi:hypothetical protein